MFFSPVGEQDHKALSAPSMTSALRSGIDLHGAGRGGAIVS
jgi:hypothetical protein